MRQLTIDEPQTEDALICAIERLGWRRLPDEYGQTVWHRGGVDRVLPLEGLAAWLASGCPEKAEPDVLEVQDAIRRNAPITRRKLKALLAKRYDVSGLAEMLEEMITDGYIEETEAGLVEVDRI